PPNLDPSPAGDWAALHRALAKRPDDRWPSVTAFVRGLLNASGADGVRVRVAGLDTDTPTVIAVPPEGGLLGPSGSGVILAEDTPRGAGEGSNPAFTPAPPELTGPGPLQPALVIGLGQTGLRVLQRLRFDLEERFGPPLLTPTLRTLFVDTDADTLAQADQPCPTDRLAGLRPDDVFSAKLNRAGHYLKPRFNGRSLTEGWFDTQLLYKIPRNPQTMGVRLFGRLAFLDHYRALMSKVQAELDAALAPEALLVTESNTGLRRRTNRPRVYLTGGLAGGTGGGMFLDLAYAVRSRLKRMGYDRPEVIGLFVVPPADATLTPPQALGNTYAALTELNHYTRPDTAFAAHYDDRNGLVRDTDAPFARCYLVPGTAAPPGPVGTSPTP
ncbi:MAG: tubulin-like doman-containing protein, partial [Gemmataceae bacterium]|nr:tubulin-like doman-containing protein [Gemmataceae bacterium]